MKTISKEFMHKIIRAGGVLDTKKYRYDAVDMTTVRRALIANLDTTAMLEEGAWEVIKVRCV